MTRKQKYFLKQKLAGVMSILMSIVFTILCDGDATISLLMVPVGDCFDIYKRDGNV